MTSARLDGPPSRSRAYRPAMHRLDPRLRAARRRAAAHHYRPADRVFVATLVIGFFAIALLLVTLYPSPMHLLRLY